MKSDNLELKYHLLVLRLLCYTNVSVQLICKKRKKKKETVLDLDFFYQRIPAKLLKWK